MTPPSSCPFHPLALAYGGKEIKSVNIKLANKHGQQLDEVWQSCPPPGHSPNTEQSIVRCPGEKIEAVAVRGSRGGEAQGRHRCGVACEFLQSNTGAQTCIRHTQTHPPARHRFYDRPLIPHVRSADLPYRPPWCSHPTSWLSDLLTAAVSHRGSRKGWSQPRDLPSTYCGTHRPKIRVV